MKLNLSHSLTLMLLFCFSFGYGQSSEAKFKYDTERYNELWDKQIKEAKSKGLFSICLKSVSIAQFVVKTDGHVDHIEIYDNKDTPSLLREVLTGFIKSTDGMWQPRVVDGKPVDSKPMILPFVYELEACGNKTVTESADATLLTFMSKFHDPGDAGQLSCVLLKPVTAFAQN